MRLVYRLRRTIATSPKQQMAVTAGIVAALAVCLGAASSVALALGIGQNVAQILGLLAFILGLLSVVALLAIGLRFSFEQGSQLRSMGARVDSIESSVRAGGNIELSVRNLAASVESKESERHAVLESEHKLHVELWRRTSAEVLEQVIALRDEVKDSGQSAEMGREQSERLAEVVEHGRYLVEVARDQAESASAAQVSESVDAVYEQVESLLMLVRSIDANVPPWPPLRGWTASPDLLRLLVAEIYQQRPAKVLELGSGVSTVIIGSALRNIGSGKLISLEHDMEYYETTSALVAEHDLADVVDVKLAPLVEYSSGGKTYSWYDLASLTSELDGLDLVFVDGPPSSVGELARYPALPVLLPHMSKGSRLILDDAKRSHEQQIISMWCERYSHVKLQTISHEKGTAVLIVGSANE